MTDDESAGEAQEPWERFGQEIGFSVSYDVGDSRHATIGVQVANSFTDVQVVVLDDPTLPFTVEATVELGRLTRLELDCNDRIHEPWDAIPVEAWLTPGGPGDVPDLYDEQITQKDLQRPFVSMLKNWAACGRERQRIVMDRVEQLGRRLTDEEISDLPAELRHEFDRLHASQEEALSNTLSALASFHSGQRRRARQKGTDTPLDQVVREYKDAVARGVRAPRALVAERLRYHPAHVGRLLSQAREQGLLPPAKPRGRPKKGQD